MEVEDPVTGEKWVKDNNRNPWPWARCYGAIYSISKPPTILFDLAEDAWGRDIYQLSGKHVYLRDQMFRDAQTGAPLFRATTYVGECRGGLFYGRGGKLYFGTERGECMIGTLEKYERFEPLRISETQYRVFVDDSYSFVVDAEKMRVVPDSETL